MAQNIMTMHVDVNPDFAPTCVQAYQQLEGMTRHASAIATYLELDPDYFQPGKRRKQHLTRHPLPAYYGGSRR